MSLKANKVVYSAFCTTWSHFYQFSPLLKTNLFSKISIWKNREGTSCLIFLKWESIFNGLFCKLSVKAMSRPIFQRLLLKINSFVTEYYRPQQRLMSWSCVPESHKATLSKVRPKTYRSHVKKWSRKVTDIFWGTGIFWIILSSI